MAEGFHKMKHKVWKYMRTENILTYEFAFPLRKKLSSDDFVAYYVCIHSVHTLHEICDLLSDNQPNSHLVF